MQQGAKKVSDKLKNMFANGWAIHSGVVKKVNESAATAIVEMLLDDEDSPTEEVLLNVGLENVKGLLMIPKEGTDCILLGVDGDAVWEIVKASEYDKVLLSVADRKLEAKDGQWTFDDGSNGTVPVSSKTKDRLNKIEQDINNLKTAFQTILTPPTLATIVEAGNGAASGCAAALAGALASWFGQQLVQTQDSDIENKKIKH